MRGTVKLWIPNEEAPSKSWGFIALEGLDNWNKAEDRVYFNMRSARYSPVRVGDVVEFEPKRRAAASDIQPGKDTLTLRVQGREN